MPSPSETDLAWLAFCYIADTMSPAERELFEERLAVDQPAREAVAEAVLLWKATSAACQVEPASRPTPAVGTQWQRLGAVRRAVAGLALGIGLGVSSLLLWQSSRDSQHAASPADGSDKLISLWAGDGEDFDAEAESPVWDADEEDFMRDQENLTVPAWMLAAVSAIEDDEEQMEN